MKRLALLIALLSVLTTHAQTLYPYNTDFRIGNGLTFDFEEGKHFFRIGGMMQPYWAQNIDSSEQKSNFLNARRVYLNFFGELMDKQVAFFMQADFARPTPLLDVWIRYRPHSQVNIYFGQKQSIANNREMLVMEDQLSFADRSLLSSTFSGTGRELGVYIEPYFELGAVRLEPKIAITSGDGLNSFGVDSRDVDLGGFKYSARLDLYPMGAFKEGNELCIADLHREDRLKLLLGAAASYNDGASGATGEGHGEFALYNANTEFQRPDYRQIYMDILAKYQGISVLGEYCISTATGLQGAFVNDLATIPLVPSQISELLALGRSWNFQIGYMIGNGWGIDARLAGVQAEFEENTNSVVSDRQGWKVGLTRYAELNNLKLGLAYGQTNIGETLENKQLELLCQLRF